MNSPMRMNHIGISVPDIDAAARWYCEVLGCYLLVPPVEARNDGSHFGNVVKDIFGDRFESVRMANCSSSWNPQRVPLLTRSSIGGAVFSISASRPQISKQWPSALRRTAAKCAVRSGSCIKTSLTKRCTAKIRGASSWNCAAIPTSSSGPIWPQRRSPTKAKSGRGEAAYTWPRRAARRRTRLALG